MYREDKPYHLNLQEPPMTTEEKISRLRLEIAAEFVTVRKSIGDPLARQQKLTTYYNELKKIIGARKALYVFIELAQNMWIFLDVKDEFWHGRVGQNKTDLGRIKR